MHYDSAVNMFVDATGNAITYANWNGGTEPTVLDSNNGCVALNGAHSVDFEWEDMPNSCVSVIYDALYSLEL